MANSNRKLILNYLRDTVLARITTGGGYNHTLATKARGLQEIDSLPDSSFPAVFISRSEEDRSNITSNQIRSSLNVVLVGYVRNDSGIDGAQEDLDNLIEDVSKAIETDRKLADTGNTKWLEIKSVRTDDGDAMPFAAFAMAVEIVYVTEGITP